MGDKVHPITVGIGFFGTGVACRPAINDKFHGFALLVKVFFGTVVTQHGFGHSKSLGYIYGKVFGSGDDDAGYGACLWVGTCLYLSRAGLQRFVSVSPEGDTGEAGD